MVPGVVVMHIGSPSIHPKKKYENKMLFEEQWIDLKEKSYIPDVKSQNRKLYCWMSWINREKRRIKLILE